MREVEPCAVEHGEAEPFEEVADVRGHRRVDEAELPLGRQRHQVEVEVGLAVEVLVDAALGDPDPLDDPAHGRVAVVVERELVEGGGDEAFALLGGQVQEGGLGHRAGSL